VPSPRSNPDTTLVTRSHAINAATVRRISVLVDSSEHTCSDTPEHPEPRARITSDIDRGRIFDPEHRESCEHRSRALSQGIRHGVDGCGETVTKYPVKFKPKCKLKTLELYYTHLK